jgi:23S rRNA (guanosine2251-2'-O)-methyltransferase
MTRRREDAPPPVVVGRRPVLEAVRAGLAREIEVAEGARPTPGLRRLLEEAEAAGVRSTTVPGERIRAAAGDTVHQGVAARVRLPALLGPSDVAHRRWPDDAVVVVLDGLTDPRNVGAVARSAEAWGASALILRRRRGAAVGPAALKASAGALLHLPVAVVPNIGRALEVLKDAGFWVVGLEGSATRTIEAERPPGRLALVVGGEGGGLSRLASGACHELLAIPMRGKVDSLNASVAVAVALFGYAGEGARRAEKKEPRA